jgi:peptide/nickel transport system permease protein
MLRLAGKRLLGAVPLLLGVCTLTFLLVEAAPGSPIDVLVGDRPVSPEVRRHIEAAYGLDRPPLARYGAWIANAATGDLGWSISQGRPVAVVLAGSLPATLLLAAAALLIQLALGLLIGALHTVRPGSPLDHALGFATLGFASAPAFWLGLMAILLFAYAIPLFPPSSLHAVGAQALPAASYAADALRHVLLPAMVLGLGAAGVVSRFVRAGLLRTLEGDFVRAARARGGSRFRVLRVHALRASAGPVITIAGLSLPLLVSGSLPVEVVFGWPGMGRATYQAILSADLPVALAAVLLATVVVVFGNLLADLALAWADPRVRMGAGGGR